MKPSATRQRELWLAVIFIGAVAVSVIPAAAQSARDKETPSSKGYLRMTVSTLIQPPACELPIELRLELTNAGAETIRIDKAELWFRYSYRQIKPEPDGYVGEGFGSRLRELSLIPGTYLEIPPGLTHTETFSLQLRDVFFQKSGKYLLSASLEFLDPNTGLHKAKSNEIEFELVSCAINRESEDNHDHQR